MQPKARILVVDDDEGLRTSIGSILELHGHSVALAPNVPEALEMLKAERFDVLLSDLRMPDPGDGLTIIHAMKQSNPKTVTLLMSGTLNADLSSAPLAEDEMLQKPLKMRSVVDLIHRKLQSASETDFRVAVSLGTSRPIDFAKHGPHSVFSGIT